MKKIKTAIFDGDLKVRTFKEFDVSDSGDKIKIKSGGEGHFMPSFNNDSYLELPRPRWKGGGWDRIYFVRKLAKSCVNFQTEEIDGPDPEVVLEAAENKILKNIGSEDKETPFIMWLMLALMFVITLKLFGVIG